MQNKHLSTVNSKVKLSEAAEGTVQKSSWTNHGNTDLSAELTKVSTLIKNFTGVFYSKNQMNQLLESF